MSAILPALDRSFTHSFVHSGQHYSYELDTVFFSELELRPPDHRLEVGSLPSAAQVGSIMAGFEEIVRDFEPDMVVVQGDTNTTLAGALVAAQHRSKGVRLCHVEAGMRSGRYGQIEETNRIIVDRVSDLLLLSNETDRGNLEAECLGSADIHVVGSTVFESCRRLSESTDGTMPSVAAGLGDKEYAVATFHRQESVDDPATLRSICRAVDRLAENIPVVFLRHPRTAERMARLGIALNSSNVRVTPAVGYRDLVTLLQAAAFCLTDSGGLQEEAAFLRTPCVILRDETEHRRYVEAGIHVLAGTDVSQILRASNSLLDRAEQERRRTIPIEFDVEVSDRVVQAIKSHLEEN
jgi:UDP-N-acetylglucosamine 2-epimerase